MKKVTKVAIIATLAGGAYYLYKKNQESNTEYDEEEFLDTEAEEIEETSEECAEECAEINDATEETEAPVEKTREQKIAEIKEKAAIVAKKAYGKAGEIGHVVAVNAEKAAKVAKDKAGDVKNFVSEKLAEKNAEAENAEDPADMIDEELAAYKDEATEINVPISDEVSDIIEDAKDPE